MRQIGILLLCCISLLSSGAQTVPNLYREVDQEKMNHWVDSVFDAMSYDERDTVMEILLESGEALAEVVVTGSNDTQNPIQAPQMGTIKITRKMIKTIPTLFGEADVIKALQTQPGVSAGNPLSPPAMGEGFPA